MAKAKLGSGKRFAAIEAKAKAANKTPEEFVKDFEKVQKERPRVTAAEFGVPKDFPA